ncbi:MAG: hypothetical protein WA364_15400 [Candidatus Nitrosopolaris sp.]
MDEKVGQLVNESQYIEEKIKPENSPTHLQEASPLSPQFECYFQCGQGFTSQSELIAHMDKESDDARQEKEEVYELDKN